MIHLLEYKCPASHTLFGSFFDTTRATPEQARKDLEAIMARLGLSRCEICGSTAFVWHEFASEFTTIAEAAGSITEKVTHNAELREKISNEGGYVFATGKYDDACAKVREETKAAGVCLMVLGGLRGSGFSVQVPEDIMNVLPQMLRHLADDIEAQQKKVKVN